MQDNFQVMLSLLRRRKARECLQAAQVLLQTENHDDVPNRTYYAVFHATAFEAQTQYQQAVQMVEAVESY